MVDPLHPDPDGGAVCDVLPPVDPVAAPRRPLRLRHPLRRLLLRRRGPVRAHDVPGRNTKSHFLSKSKFDKLWEWQFSQPQTPRMSNDREVCLLPKRG